MLPLALTETALMAAEEITLPPVTLALTETVVPVKLVALTLAPPSMFPPVILPEADTEAALTAAEVIMLPPVTLALALTETALIAAEEITLPPITLPVADTLPVALTAPAVTTLPALTLPAADTNPVVRKFPDCVLPATVSKFGPAVSNVRPALAPALPLLLNITCVFDPGTVKLPVMLPVKLPTK